MQIQRTRLLNALKLALSGTASDQQWDSAVFHSGWLSSYNDSISVSASVEELKDLSAVVKVAELQKLVQKLKGDLIDITDGPDKLTLECGNTSVELAKFPDAISSYIASLALDTIKWSELPKDFGSILSLCRLDNLKWKRPVVHFTGPSIMADEGIRTNYGTVDGDLPTFSLHTATAKELLGMGPLSSYCLQGTWLHVFTASGAIFSAKVFPEPYPAHMLTKFRTTWEALDPMFTVAIPSGLADAVDRVETFAQASQTGTLSVKVHITSEAMLLKTEKTAGSVKERIFWESPLPEGTELEFEASVPYLKEAAKRVQTFSVVLDPVAKKEKDVPESQWETVKVPRLMFHGENFLQVVLVGTK